MLVRSQAHVYESEENERIGSAIFELDEHMDEKRLLELSLKEQETIRKLPNCACCARVWILYSFITLTSRYCVVCAVWCLMCTLHSQIALHARMDFWFSCLRSFFVVFVMYLKKYVQKHKLQGKHIFFFIFF